MDGEYVPVIDTFSNRLILLLSLAVCLLIPLSLRAQVQVGYTLLTPDGGTTAPTGTALFTFTNPSGFLVSQAGVGAVEPITSGRIFVDERGTLTALALANPNAAEASVTMVVRDAAGAEVGSQVETLAAGAHLARFVSELFTESIDGFTGSFTFTSTQPIGAIAFRQTLNEFREPMYSTLPVVDLNAAPGSDPVVFPHIAVGEGYTTQIVLINGTDQAMRGTIRLVQSNGQALSARVGETVGSEFPYEIPPHGTFQPELEGVDALSVGYALATPDPGQSSPAGTAIFLYKSGEQLITEAGVAATPATTSARIFVDHGGTRTGVAIANPNAGSAEMVITLLDRNGFAEATVTRELAAGNHLAVFAHELFPELIEGFTGLMEIESTVPIVPITLKLTTENTTSGLVLTTQPVADLDRPPEAPLLVFPQIAIGGGFSMQLILMSADVEFPSRGNLRFYESGGSLLTVPMAGVTGNQFAFEVVGGKRFFPGNDASVASIALLDRTTNEPTLELVVNEGESARPLIRVIDSQGQLRDDFAVTLTSTSEDVATIDNTLGVVYGGQAGFSTMVLRAGQQIGTATISVVHVVSGVTGFGTAIVQDQVSQIYVASAEEHVIRSSVDLKVAAEVYAGVEQTPGLVNGAPLDSLFKAPSALVIDHNTGSLYISDSENHVIRKAPLGAEGQVETYAGTGTAGNKDDAVAQASFDTPQGIALDNSGNLWVVDSGNHTIRRIDLVAGTVVTIAGTAGSPGDADGVGSEARFNSPVGIALEPETQAQRLERELLGLPPPPDHMIVADTGNGTLRRVSPEGAVETLMEPVASIKVPRSKKYWLSRVEGNMPALSFNGPTGVAVDSSGNIYVTEPGTRQVRVVLSGSEVVSISPPDSFEQPEGILVGREGRVLVADAKRSVQEIRYGGPEITTIEPLRVSNLGGDMVTIRGRNFEPNSVVIVGGVQVRNAVLSDTETITFPAPRLPSGLVTVTIQNRGGLVQKPLLVDPVPLSALPEGQITTIAGGNTYAGDGTLAVQAQVAFPTAMAFGAGHLFIADTGNNRIRRIDGGTGIISTVAGTGRRGFSRDGDLALVARLAGPQGVALDVGQNIYIADTGNHRVRRVDAVTGIITTVAGTGGRGSTGDNGAARNAMLDTPSAVAVDGSRNLYIADTGSHRIRRVDAATGVITTLAGTGVPGSSGDGGAASGARLDSPGGVAVDPDGNVFIADTGNSRIRRVDAQTGQITTFAGSGEEAFADGAALSASFWRPRGVAVDADGNVFIADWGNSRIRRIDGGTGAVTTVAGDGSFGFSGDGGPATDGALASPYGVAADASGNVFVADTFNHRVRRVLSQDGIISTLAGDGFTRFSGDGGFAHGATLGQPESVTRDSAGNLFIADTSNHRVRRVDGVTGIITTIAGNGTNGFGGDGGPASEAILGSPQGVVTSAAGDVFIADTFNSRVRRVDSSGIISTIAGNGEYGFSGDGGPATGAALTEPRGLALGPGGNLYIADGANNRIRVVDLATGVIDTFAGNGEGEYTGDGGAAELASLYDPGGIAFDADGNLLIADTGNNVIRMVSAGSISTVAGNGERAFSGDGGPAVEAALADPASVAADDDGNLYIADTFNDRIRRVDAVSGLIMTLAGSGRYGFSGDNVPAREAALADPGAVLLDEDGNVYLADSTNDRIRAIRGSAPIPPTEGCSPITSGQTVNGAFGPGDRTSRNRTGVFADCYTFPGSLGDRVSIQMNATELDPYLFLMNGVGRIIEFDDDGGEGLNAMLPPSGALLLPASGTYVIEATSYSDAAEGAYTLSLTVAPDVPLACGAIARGQTIEGELDGSDARSSHRQSYGDCYTFSANEGDRVAVTLSSPDFDTYLYLVSPEGRVIASNDDAGDGTNSRLPARGSAVLSTAGTYTIEVAAYSSGTGAYSLRLAEATPTSLACSAIEMDRPVTGSFGPDDGSSRNRSDSPADCYTFTGAAGRRLAISMNSEDFDTYLYLMDASGEVIDSNDDGGTGTNSRIAATLPATGSYIVEATSYSDSASGRYALTLRTAATVTSRTCSAITVGQTVGGELTLDDAPSRTRTGSQADCYTLSADSSTRVAISLSSDEFDTYLYLLDSAGEVLESNDDGGSGTNSRITFLTSPSTTYTIEASAYSEAETGTYTLFVSRISFDTSTECGRLALTGESAVDLVQGSLASGDRESRTRGGSYADCYLFSGSAGDRVSILMSSDAFDTYLYLYDSTGELLDSDDDGGDGSNSRIRSFRIPETGTYIIEATSFSSEATGAYTVALAGVALPACAPINYGDAVGGSLSTGDGESRNRVNSRADCYTFTATAGDSIDVTLESGDFDTYLYLMDASGAVVEFDDDGGSGINSRIARYVATATGSLTIEATSYSGDVTGNYMLTLARNEPVQCASIRYGQTITGEFSTSDGTSIRRADSHADCYTFSGAAGDAVVISMTSTQVDTYLYLYDSAVEEVAANDDGGDGTDSLITFTLPASGAYTIAATTYDSSELGSYVLSLSRGNALSFSLSEPPVPEKIKPDPYAPILKETPIASFVEKKSAKFAQRKEVP